MAVVIGWQTVPVLRIGLTGGIGAGKSAVARLLTERGAVLVDSDAIARDVVEPGTPGLAAVTAEFGEDVLLPSGELDRPALGAVVFGDPQRLAALNAIVHPLVGARAAELVAAAPPDAVLVHDVPLLVENGLAPHYHLVVVVEAPEDVRIARLTGSRGMAESDARARMASQATPTERAAAADVLIRNDGHFSALGSAVGELWRARLAPYAANLADGRPAAGSRPPEEGEYVREEARLRARLGALGAVIERAGDPDNLGFEVSLSEPSEGVGALADSGWVGWQGWRARSADPGRPGFLELRKN
ncbi:MAG: coaE [Actinomycetia bacterium]|nr:coaE [Actinomycetes bacterium]